MRKAIILGDTSYFHIGSKVNCSNLVESIRNRYDLVGIFCGDDFVFETERAFLDSINKSHDLLDAIGKSDVVFFNGEGYLEKDSNHADALLYVARYIKCRWPPKELYLINFSCFDPNYWDWSLFTKIVPRESTTLQLLSPYHENMSLGFDCTILQKDMLGCCDGEKDVILLFQGRKEIGGEEIRLISDKFPTKKIVRCSAFWKFNDDESVNIKSLDELQCLLKRAYLSISSSFHGIVFSVRFGVPFLPIDTLGTDKNAAVSLDVLGTDLFERRSLVQWLDFYRSDKNHLAVQECLRKGLPSLCARALAYANS